MPESQKPLAQRDAKGRFLKGVAPPWGFKPGVSGNPFNHMPSITTLLKQLLKDNPDEAKAIAKSWLAQAKKGQIEHLKLTLRQLKELEPEGVDVTSKGEAVGTFILRTADGDRTAKELKDADK